MGLFARRSLLVLILILFQGFYVIVFASSNHVTFSGDDLVLCFLYGILLFRFRDLIPCAGGLAVFSCVMAMFFLWLPHGDVFVALPAAYLTVYCGLLNPPRQKLILSGDYSYGIYLYGFPIQQAFAALGPSRQPWWLNLAATYPVIISFAILSWWLIEKPAIGLKAFLYDFERFIMQNGLFARYSQISFGRRRLAFPGR